MLEENTLSFIDYGCAEGAGTAYIASRFPSLQIRGVDFSEAAIQKAIIRYPQCAFEVGDLTGDLKETDIAFSSNTIEHLNNPRKVLEQLVKSAKKAAIVILPFEDDLSTKEHFHTFGIGFFPVEIGDHSLTYFKIIDCRNMQDTKWMGKQILLVYTLSSENNGLSMAELYTSWIDGLVEENNTLQQDIVSQQEQHDMELQRQHRKHEEEWRRQQNQFVDTVSEYSNQKAAEITSALDRINGISHSKPYRLAHYLVEFWHAFFGNKQERILGKKYLFKDRTTITDYNYMESMRSMVLSAGDTSTLNKQLTQLLLSRSSSVIQKAIDNYPGKDVYVLPALVDWNIPLFQRPQQIAMGLAHNDSLYFYLTPNYIDHIEDPVVIENNLILIRQETLPMIVSIANKANKRVVFNMYSTGNSYGEEWIEQWAENDYAVLYEYVDEISEDISGMKIPETAMKRHKSFLKNPNIYMVATAEKLYNEVVAARGTKNVLFSGNGVDVRHFQQPVDWSKIPNNLTGILKSGRPVIGYFGAIAMWFDFDLIIQAATERPDYYFLLIGPHYSDLSKLQSKIDALTKKENVVFTGTIDYKVLPHIANQFTVATIPFLLNEITESTSPIKLYEYMAMGKPIVTTAMRECMKHPEVMIAHDAEEYIRLLDQAVSIVNSPDYPAYVDNLHQVGEKNSWDEKAREIMQLIREG